MFFQQYTCQPSTSPSPISQVSLATSESSETFASYPLSNAYCNETAASEIPPYRSYIQLVHQAYAKGMVTPPIKQELYADRITSSFYVSYAIIAGVNVNDPVSMSYKGVAAVYHYYPPARFVHEELYLPTIMEGARALQ
jgi:hypothetical protein